MLDAMRRGALNWFAKGLLGLLVVAFAVWGIGDGIRRIGRSTVAKIGSTDISVEEFRQAYNDELTSLSRRAGRRLTPQEAKQLHVEHRTLSRLVGTAAINAHAHQLGLSLSEKAVADMIRDDPAFRDAQGNFSRRILQERAHQIGMSPERYVELRRTEEIRDQLVETLLAGVAPPATMIDILHHYTADTRVLDYFNPDFEKLVKVTEPDEGKLKEYYEQNKRQFVTPEVRKVDVLLLTRNEAKQRITISDADVQAAYDATKDKYNIPEKRHVLQLSFPDKAAAEKAYTELAKAKDFKAAAEKLGFKESDIDLGVLDRKNMIDAKVADAAFALKKDELSKPVEGEFAIVLLRVTDIVPGKQRTFEDVKGEIRDRLADERAAQELQELHDKVENARFSAKSLKETGESLNLTYKEIAEIDKAGNTSAGTPALEGPEAKTIAQAAFTIGPGEQADPVELADGGYAWIDVLGITPEKQKSFEEAQSAVKAAAMEADKRKQISALAAGYVDRLNKGDTMETVAKETGAKVEKTKPLTRLGTPPEGLPQSAVQIAFTLPKDTASSVAAAGDGRTIIRVEEITPAPAPTPEQVTRLKTALAGPLQTDLLAEYIAGLQTRYGMKVNESVLRQAIGTGQDQSEGD